MPAAPTEYLLIVTEDGMGRRVAVDEIRRTKGRGGVGVTVSKSAIAAALVVSDDDGDVLIASAGGIVQRVALASIPIRRRIDPSSGRIPKGARVMTLDSGDKVATVAVEMSPADRVETAAPAIRGAEWPGHGAGLQSGERTRSVVVFAPMRERDDPPTGALVGDQDPDVHAVSSYWCDDCGRQHPDAEAVYACLDGHVAKRAQRALALTEAL
jgi:hypothetical protein